MPKFFLFLLAAALVSAVWQRSADAHPHVWIDVKVEVVFDEKGQVTGLREIWIFDELYTAFVSGGLDKDSDGQADEDVLAELLQANMTSLRDYDYFTRVEVGGEAQRFDKARDAENWVERDKLRMRFFLPLAEPVSPQDGQLRYAVYDPTYYVELIHSPAADAIVLSGASETCSYALQAPNPNPDTVSFAASLDQTESGGDGLGIYFAEWVDIACD